MKYLLIIEFVMNLKLQMTLKMNFGTFTLNIIYQGGKHTIYT